MRWSLISGLLALSGRANAQFQIIVTSLPKDTPAEASIYLAGNFNGWNPQDDKYRLLRQDDGTWSVSITNPPDTIEFKFTQGAWTSVETDAEGKSLPNRRAAANAHIMRVSIAAWKDTPEEQRPSTAAPNVQIIKPEMVMPQLEGRKRTIRLYLPPDYDNNRRRRYPVIYLQDGQNVFDDATSFAGEWDVDGTLNALFREGDRGAIVVAVDNGAEKRMAEYAPWAHPKFGGGEGDKYVEFIIKTLKPYIDAQYRTRPERKHTTIAGSSMGGLISLYAALRYPQVFGNAGVLSPSLWFAEDIFTLAEKTPLRPRPRIYLMAGAQESERMVADVRRLEAILKGRGYTPSNLHAIVHQDGKHSEWYWRREWANIYRWLTK